MKRVISPVTEVMAARSGETFERPGPVPTMEPTLYFHTFRV